MSFEEWCKELDKENAKYSACDQSLVEQTGEEWWKYYYEEDFTPAEAYAEDCSNKG